MDGFTGFKSATTEELPDAVAVMDPFCADVLAMPMLVVDPWLGAGSAFARSA